MRVEADWHLPVSPDEAWRALLRWEDQTRWIRDTVSVRVLSPHREGVGVRIAVKSRVYDVPLFTEVLEVTRWEPPHVLEMTHRSFIRGVGTWALEPDGAGARFRWSEDLALPIPVLSELALLVYRPYLRRLMRGGLRDLSASLRSS